MKAQANRTAEEPERGEDGKRGSISPWQYGKGSLDKSLEGITKSRGLPLDWRCCL